MSPPSRLPTALQTALRVPLSMNRELIGLAVGLVFGLAVAPPLVWVVGSKALGPYAGGGIGAFLAAFYRGLWSGTFGYWMIVVGPYLVALLVRALISAMIFGLNSRRTIPISGKPH